MDDQAIDRSFRIGQKRNVVCYRFVTVGTVEEKMTRIQVKKTSLARKVLNEESQRSYSTLNELRDLFTLDDPDSENRLFRVIQQRAASSSQSIESSVRSTLTESTSNHEIDEILTQLAALNGNQEEQDSPLARLFAQGVVAGVSDRAGLFSPGDKELEQTMKLLSLDDKQAMNKVVEDAMGWLMTKG